MRSVLGLLSALAGSGLCSTTHGRGLERNVYLNRTVKSGFARYLFVLFVHLGGFGQFVLGVLDSSFLFMPLGNDLLMVALSARKHELMLYYAAMATVGSVLGCWLLDAVVRKHGEEGLEKYVSRRRLEYVKKKVTKSAGWALTFASLMPPPFPFTPFVAASAALQYPRKRLLIVIGITRMLRFTAVGWLAILFGRRILRWARSPIVEYAVLALIVVCVAGSIVSVVTWIKRSRTQPARQS
jgi:membrane protein YqaA with SNARE-associated domain